MKKLFIVSIFTLLGANLFAQERRESTSQRDEATVVQQPTQKRTRPAQTEMTEDEKKAAGIQKESPANKAEETPRALPTQKTSAVQYSDRTGKPVIPKEVPKTEPAKPAPPSQPAAPQQQRDDHR